MFASMSDAGISCYGSPSPRHVRSSQPLRRGDGLLVHSGHRRLRLRVRSPQSAGADTGTRFLVKYSGFPTTTRLFIPDAVAGSDALQPTSGGDLNLPQAVGQYMPGSGALVLVRVPGADATGAGGFAVAPPQGSGPVTLSSVSEVTLTNGSGYAVYEVAAANPNVQESAQFPTFIALPRFTATGRRPGDHRPGPGLLRDHRFGHRAHPALRRRRRAERLQAAGRLQAPVVAAAQTSRSRPRPSRSARSPPAAR